MSLPPHLLSDYVERSEDADATNEALSHAGPVGESLAVLFREHWNRMWPGHVWRSAQC